MGSCSRLASTAVVSSCGTRMLREVFAFFRPFLERFSQAVFLTAAWAFFECVAFAFSLSTFSFFLDNCPFYPVQSSGGDVAFALSVFGQNSSQVGLTVRAHHYLSFDSKTSILACVVPELCSFRQEYFFIVPGQGLNPRPAFSLSPDLPPVQFGLSIFPPNP